jgi:hypothetical protein
MTVTAPETEARNAIVEILQDEFGDDGFLIRQDRLHASLGHERTVIGVYPLRSQPGPGNYEYQESEIVVQFFGRYKLDIDPEQKVDPTPIETYAERFRRAIQSADFTSSGRVWYFNLLSVEYPPDATGNITRFVATIRAYGNNPAIVETAG